MTPTQSDIITEALLKEPSLCEFRNIQPNGNGVDVFYPHVGMTHCTDLIDFCNKHGLVFYFNRHIRMISVTLVKNTTDSS